ncbi:3-ketoacyl-CoA thiolase, mitochondrial [Plutella xylostella]|uniref:3-ketoacyl-CoA thiolase, mitochondrial n=1 Tax=Plutella xylostella TaxID=51655 RepID=UPI0020328636|nr:3-ketoacyl-CoA thiolase, mitochondrial [Plutella xylostella]
MALSKEIFIVAAKRTPFCQYGGALRELPAALAFAAAAKEAMQTARIDPSIVDATIVGNVNFLSQCDGGKTARHCGLYSGVPVERPALGVNLACGAGLQAVISGCIELLTTPASVILTGGTEIMSSLPLLVRNARFGTTLGAPYQLEEYISKQHRDSYSGLTLQESAEMLAKEHQVTRKEVDEFALQSHLRWNAAHEAGILKEQIAPVTVTIKNKQLNVDADDVRDVTEESLSELTPSVEDGTVVTEGNSSRPADGAAAIILADASAISRYNLTPLARVVAWSRRGVAPARAGGAAQECARELLSGRDVDLIEINETFAAQALITARELRVDRGRVNVNGGALAVGHPAAATGAAMAVNLVYELRRRNLKTAVATSSCGGGQGVAIMLEGL